MMSIKIHHKLLHTKQRRIKRFSSWFSLKQEEVKEKFSNFGFCYCLVKVENCRNYFWCVKGWNFNYKSRGSNPAKNFVNLQNLLIFPSIEWRNWLPTPASKPFHSLSGKLCGKAQFEYLPMLEKMLFRCSSCSGACWLHVLTFKGNSVEVRTIAKCLAAKRQTDP